MKKILLSIASLAFAFFASLAGAQTFPVQNLQVNGTSSFTGTSSFGNISATGTVNFNTSQITAGYLSPLTGAVNRTLAGKLGDWVSVMDYGCDATGVASSSACFNAAAATGKDIYIPPGIYKLTTLVTFSTANQYIRGAGRASALINCVLASSGNCIAFTGATGNQTISDVTVTTGNTNTTKLFDVLSPQVRIVNLYMQNLATSGYAIYVEDENSGSNIFGFGLQVVGCQILGAGNATSWIGIRLGLNSQTALIKSNIIENGNTGISIVGANESSAIEDNVLENLQVGVGFAPSGGTPPFWAISIRRNYFEQILSAGVLFGGSGGVFSNIAVSDSYATSGGGTVYFVSITNASVGGASNGNRFENNYIQGFTAAFNLVDVTIAQSASSFRGNTLDTTAYSTGTNSLYAYATRVMNPYFSNALVSGSFGTKGVNRMEMSAGDYQVPLRLEPHEFIEKIQFHYLAVGTTQMTVTLWKLGTSSDTPTSVTSTTGTTTGDYTLSFNGYIQENTQYYLEIVMVLNGGTTAYIYPFVAYVRQ
jgi:hypothetical protein